MKIVGLLSWYDEPASWLAECVASAAKICDHLIAVDGAYAKFPGALSRPRSGTEEADVIMHAATGAGIGCTIHARTEPWWGNEVEKRDWMFRLAETVTTGDDWLFVIDADEVVSTCPPDTRQLLEKSEHDVGELRIWENDGTNIAGRRFLRALRGIHAEGAHYVWTAPGPGGKKQILRGTAASQKLAPCEDLWNFRLEHKQQHRATGRRSLKAEYYTTITSFERPEATP